MNNANVTTVRPSFISLFATLDVESTSHFFLHCLDYNDSRPTLLNKLKSVDENILKLSGNKLINLLLLILIRTLDYWIQQLHI